MDFIRRFIEQKLSAATGAPVRFGAFSFSPFSGTVELRDVTIGSLLSVRRIEAKLAVARALKQEIVVRSLAIEGPALTIIRRKDGSTNLPTRPARVARAEGAESSKSWEFEAHKVLLVGGRVEITDEKSGGYRASMENVTGSMQWELSTVQTMEFVFTVDSLGRRDRAAELGQARLNATLTGVSDLSAIASAALMLSLEAGTTLKVEVKSPSMSGRHFQGTLQFAAEIEVLMKLLPNGIRLPITPAGGDVSLRASAEFDPASGLRIDDLELRAKGITASQV